MGVTLESLSMKGTIELPHTERNEHSPGNHEQRSLFLGADQAFFKYTPSEKDILNMYLRSLCGRFRRYTSPLSPFYHISKVAIDKRES